MRSLAFALLLAAFLPAGVHAQTAILVRDINPNPPAGSPGLEPSQFAAAGGRAVFLAPEGTDYLLWATDGTVAGTSPLARLCAPCGFAPQRAAQLPGLAFYTVVDDNGASHLWRTDGTRAGTFPLSPPLQNAYTASTFGRRLLFEVCDGNGACALWITDGSPAGTRPLQGALSAGRPATGDGRAFFFGRDARGDALWVTDGTPEGTRRLHAVHYADLLTVSGSRAFYLDGGGDYPDELWTSDGTARGTRFVRRFYQPDEHYPPNTGFLKAVAGGIVFVATLGRGDEINLWRSDGTPAGTRRITAFPDPSLEPLTPDGIVPVGNRLLFVATNAAGPRLWWTDGSPAGTAPLTGCPGGCPALQPYWPLIPTAHGVLFTASDPAHGMELWTTDGTGAGTHLFRDLCPGACDSNPEAFTQRGGIIDFRATFNGQSRLVRTDGVSAVELAPIPPAAFPPYGGLFPLDLADVGSRTFFTGLDAQGRQPWVTDGTPAGTRRLAGTASGGSDPRDFAVLGDRLLLTASDGATRSVWTVDAQGTAAPIPGTGVAIDRPGPSGLTVSGGLAYFVSDLGADGMELWRTDGTPAGTLQLAAFPDKALSDLRDVGGRLVLLAQSTTGEQPVFSLWTSDGTPAGTVQRLGLPSDTVGISAVTALGPELYFALQSETASWIYRSDGTAAGTRTILQEGDGCEDPGDGGRFVRLEGLVYFPACGPDGITLDQTDGTPAGTAEVASFANIGPEGLFAFQGELYYFGYNPDPERLVNLILWKGRTAAEATPLKGGGFSFGDPIAPEFTPLGDRLYFRAWDPAHGFELWRTDGTPAGTVLVRDLAPGPASGDPQGLVAAGGRLWFSALDPDHGRELWTSDGTRAGTRLAVDLAPGPSSAAPEQLTPFGGRLYCAADDGVVGREVWRLDIP
jgi:ELWxxDGT repeat protein